ncbi:MAG TPA: DNA polymerase Y family protein [Mycobacteriales bacterium]|nr:DNA polymerase Y family protein [Mycobacteriales bacterium]
MAAPSPPRLATLWCPDWPVTAARAAVEIPGDTPIAVLTANHVVACSMTARSAGVRRGMRRREAQSCCPELLVVPRDERAEARCFEPVIVAVESMIPAVEVTRPGLASVGVRGSLRRFGNEAELVAALWRAVAWLTEDACQIGVADGPFAAEQAARRGVVVPAGDSADFLADLPVTTLSTFGHADLVDLLQRLGIHTLGAFAALPAREVMRRFGPTGAWAHRQAGGRDARPILVREPPPECTVTVELETPVDRVDVVAFSARSAAERFIADLAARGEVCICFELEAYTDHGDEHTRRWRHPGVLTATDVVDRIRWQLEGWLRGLGDPDDGAESGLQPSVGITRLRFVPVETVPTGTHQQPLWGGPGDTGERAHRGLARVQTMLGLGGVVLPVVDGGRGPTDRTRLVPWGEERTPVREPTGPWPGRLPSPAPSVLITPPSPVEVVDETGHPVVVTERGAVLRPPARLRTETTGSAAVISWAGPWPVDERWWDPEQCARVARLQLVDLYGRAYLVVGEMARACPPRWFLEGVYD